ncbi:MAG: hypothetical protein FJ100_03920 [Deltaproteobacteria bacterium]|nr:hypothetical protein [Deltaproteobacteria bacterium]
MGVARRDGPKALLAAEQHRASGVRFGAASQRGAQLQTPGRHAQQGFSAMAEAGDACAMDADNRRFTRAVDDPQGGSRPIDAPRLGSGGIGAHVESIVQPRIDAGRVQPIIAAHQRPGRRRAGGQHRAHMRELARQGQVLAGTVAHLQSDGPRAPRCGVVRQPGFVGDPARGIALPAHRVATWTHADHPQLRSRPDLAEGLTVDQHP